jgi:hypothetical protein
MKGLQNVVFLSTVAAVIAQHDWTNTGALQKFPLFSVVATKEAGVSTEIGTTHKYEGNPLWGQDVPWEPRLDNGYPNVIYDPSDPLGAWRMWYGASLWEYATSSDGIKWTKPDLGMFDLSTWDRKWAKYGKHNNVIMHCEGCGIYKDIHEPDPQKRFKAFGGPACPFGKGGGARIALARCKEQRYLRMGYGGTRRRTSPGLTRQVAQAVRIIISMTHTRTSSGINPKKSTSLPRAISHLFRGGQLG